MESIPSNDTPPTANARPIQAAVEKVWIIQERDEVGNWCDARFYASAEKAQEYWKDATKPWRMILETLTRETLDGSAL